MEKAPSGGQCGDDVYWKLENGVLTITGTGAMWDFQTADAVPWYGARKSITAVMIGSGVTTIGNYAFQNCDLTEISIPASVTSIGDSAFYIIRIWRPSRSWTARTTQPSKNSLLKTAAV